ncbi:TDT family transporter [Nocardioides sp. Kera G14]|uniref:TDT family transporter n=1 Tax=Nocardioides sp. Kera G14 TaxID=2884264 RepID=UPI001D12556E|nr:TDT family transporter [Nocardioides sp. Kera G14]UDY24846.1 TDT family transporter [Nocardioides sp. Kera G14]
MTPYGPNWFAMVMGTGILGIAIDGLPVDVPARADLALAVWLLAVVLLVVVAVTAVRARLGDPALLRRHLDDQVMGHFYGAPAMALMTVGTGALLCGQQLLGGSGALVADAVLWTSGTLLGLWTAVWLPVTAIARHQYGDADASGGWLMPVVPPMVSAATGALLVPYVGQGQPQETLLLACYACFGLSLLAALMVFGQLWARLVRHGAGPAAAVPTLWIPLGFLGQSVTAAHHLGVVAPGVLPEYGHAFRMLTLLYGVPVWGFALAWLTIAVALTREAVTDGLPFSLTWWSFTFPLGTVVTGTSALAASTGLVLFQVVAAFLLLALAGLWTVVAALTSRLLLGAPRTWLARAA